MESFLKVSGSGCEVCHNLNTLCGKTSFDRQISRVIKTDIFFYAFNIFK